MVSVAKLSTALEALLFGILLTPIYMQHKLPICCNSWRNLPWAEFYLPIYLFAF